MNKPKSPDLICRATVLFKEQSLPLGESDLVSSAIIACSRPNIGGLVASRHSWRKAIRGHWENVGWEIEKLKLTTAALTLVQQKSITCPSATDCLRFFEAYTPRGSQILLISCLATHFKCKLLREYTRWWTNPAGTDWQVFLCPWTNLAQAFVDYCSFRVTDTFLQVWSFQFLELKE